MRFLPFDSDETFGDAAAYGGGFHDVVVEISGYYQSTLPSWGYDSNAAGIQAVLNSKNWIVERVNNVSTSWFPQASGGFTYRVYAVVGNAYSDAAVRDSMRRDLEGFFNVTGITILSPAFPPASPTQPRPTGSGGSNSGGIYANPLPPSGVTPGTTGFVDNLALGLGVSAPVAIAIAAGVAILILKR